MARRRIEPEPDIQPREFRSTEEIDRSISKLERRVKELEILDVVDAISNDTAADDNAIQNVRNTILEIFGEHSPEYRQHKHIQLWAGPLFIGMARHEVIAGTERGRTQTVGILRGLIQRLREKREDMEGGAGPPVPSSYFDKLNLHPRIGDVARELFLDGHHWDAVFAASKALVNYVKERSGSDLDGAKLMHSVFSKNNPLLAFNALANQTDADQQEGIMHLFVGATLAIRNPGGHGFPEGSEQRAIEYISFLSTLAFLVQEAKKQKPRL